MLNFVGIVVGRGLVGVVEILKGDRWKQVKCWGIGEATSVSPSQVLIVPLLVVDSRAVVGEVGPCSGSESGEVLQVMDAPALMPRARAISLAHGSQLESTI